MGTERSSSAASLAELYDEAVRHHMGGRLTDAERLYRQILAVDAAHADALHMLGLVAHRVGRLDIAAELIGKAIEARPGSAAFHSNMGVVLQDLGRHEAALASYDAALRVAPGNAGAHFNRGNLLNLLGRPEDALASYAAAIHIKPDHAEAHFNHAKALKDLGRLEEALASYDALLGIKADYVEAHFNRGNVESDLGRLDKALACYQDALRLKPQLAKAHYSCGNALRELGRFGESVAAYRKALCLEPGSAEALTNLGSSLFELGQAAEAEAAVRRSLAIDAEIVESWNALLGFVLQDGRMDEAVEVGRTALALKDRLTAKPYGDLATVAPPGAPEPGKPWIIAFSLWGRHQTYVSGALENAASMRRLFPEWRCRFYCDDSVPLHVREALAGHDAEIVMMPGSDGFERFAWRFLAASDPGVGRFICRDCDSRPSRREAAAVAEWVASGRSFHILRDHPKHADLILAGLWGGVAGVLPDMAGLIADFQFRSKFCDQRFLGEVVWPRIKTDVLIHDSYYDLFGSRPFPTGPADPSDHVGMGLKFGG